MKNKLVYFVKEALISFKRNWVMSMAAIIVVSFTLFIVGLFAFFTIIGGAAIITQERKVEITVFLNEVAPSEGLQAFQNKILSWSEVSKIHYVSKEEAMRRLKQMFKGAPEVLEELPGNPLPPSLEIRLKDPHQTERVAKRIKRYPNIKEIVDKDVGRDIQYGEKVVRRLFQVTRFSRWIGIIFFFLLSFVSIVLIVSTVRLAIFARRREVAVMKLVGATNWFIRWPFMLEGISQGLIGALLAIGVLYLIKKFSFRWLLDFFRIPFSYSTSLLSQFSLLLLTLGLGGILIGALGSAIALRRFLKV